MYMQLRFCNSAHTNKKRKRKQGRYNVAIPFIPFYSFSSTKYDSRRADYR